MNRHILKLVIGGGILLSVCPMQLAAWTPPEEIRWTAVIAKKSEPVILDPEVSKDRIRPIEEEGESTAVQPSATQTGAEAPAAAELEGQLTIEKVEGWKQGDTYRMIEIWSDGEKSEAWAFSGIYLQQVRGWSANTLYARHIDSGGVAEHMPFFALSLLKPGQQGREVKLAGVACLYFETDDPFMAGIGRGRSKIWIHGETGLPVMVEAGGTRTIFTFVEGPVVLPEPPKIFQRYRDGIQKRFAR